MADFDNRLKKLKNKIEKPDDKSALNESSGIKIVSDLISGLIVGAVIGYVTDKLTGLSPLFLIIFMILGFFIGFYIFYKDLDASNRKKENKK